MGKILFVLRQVPFDLPGGIKHQVDFMAFTPDDCLLIEAKGKDLREGKIKRLQVEELYNVKIHVVHSASEIGMLFS